MVVCYLGLVEVGKRLFYGATGPVAVAKPVTSRRHRRRRAAVFSTGPGSTPDHAVAHEAPARENTTPTSSPSR